MKKVYRSIPLGIMAASIATVYDWWEWELTAINVLSSAIAFAVISAIFCVINEGILGYSEKAESLKDIIKISFVISSVIFVFAFLVKTH